MPWYVGLIFLGVGVLLVLKTQWFYDFVGPIDWAERVMGSSGGTRLFLKLLGIVLIFGTFLGWTGILGSWFSGIFGPVIGNV